MTLKTLSGIERNTVENQASAGTKILNSPGCSEHGLLKSRSTVPDHSSREKMYQFGIYHFPELTYFDMNYRQFMPCLCSSSYLNYPGLTCYFQVPHRQRTVKARESTRVLIQIS